MAETEPNIIKEVIYTRNGDTLYQVSDGNGRVVQVDAFEAGTGMLVTGDKVEVQGDDSKTETLPI